jgi:hypothetical protein
MAEKQRFSVAVVGLIAIFGYLFIYHYHHEQSNGGIHLGDFRTFYQAGQFVRAHRDIYTAGYNDAQKYVYPPLIAVACVPLTYLPEVTAAHVALALDWLTLLASLLLAARIMTDRLPGGRGAGVCAAAFIAAVLGENEMRAELTMLETDALMLLMFTLALWWLDKKPILAGLALALAFNIKYLPVVALPYLLIRRRWTASAAMILGCVFFALLPALALGWNEDVRCLRVSMGGLLLWVGVSPQASHSITVHNIADTLSVSVTSAVARVLQPLGFSNAAAMAMATCIAIGVLAIIVGLYRKDRLPFWRWPGAAEQAEAPFKALVACEWAGLITAAIAFSPDTNPRHLVLAVLVNTLAAVLLLTPRPGESRVWLVAAALIIFVAFMAPFRSPWIHRAWFRYSIPCWGLLIGYMMIARTAVMRSRASLAIPEKSTEFQ